MFCISEIQVLFSSHCIVVVITIIHLFVLSV